MQVSARVNAAALSSLGQGASQEFTPHFYQRLPHPLSHLLKELPIVDGTDVNLLCDFLLKVLKIRQVGQLPDQTIYEVMYPYCRGELLAFMTSTITATENLENFHARLLGQFLPCRQISQLRIERYERAQFEGVPLATYVQSIRDAALMLRIREDETRVVERIVEGFTPAQRARFVFQVPLSSLEQLEHLAAVDRNIAYADRTRTGLPTAVTVGVVEAHTQIEAPRSVHSPSRRVLRPGKPVVCFYCRKPGHVQNRCFLRLSQLRKFDRPVTTGKPRLVTSARKIVGVATSLPPQIMAQVGKLNLPVLLDSGSARSLISFDHFQQLSRGDSDLQLVSTGVTCVMASGQSLEIVGQVKVRLKIYGFSWPWVFLVSRRLRGQPILGADFISKTKLILELGSSRCRFVFAPSVCISFIQGRDPRLFFSVCRSLPRHPKSRWVNCPLLSNEG